jgi:hypothetical protein
MKRILDFSHMRLLLMQPPIAEISFRMFGVKVLDRCAARNARP